jgi:hypothetical protein
MRMPTMSGIGLAAMLVVSSAALAQTTPQAPGDEPAQPAQATPAQTPPAGDRAATMTLVGCLMSEPDYRRAHNLGNGALGGVGLGDEFVLVDASAVGAASASAPSASCTEQGTGTAYRLTGKIEEAPLKALVGHRVEVTGRMKHAASTTTAQSGSKLPEEFEIVSYHEATGGMAATSPQPAPSTTPPVSAPSTPAPTVSTPTPAPTPEPRTPQPNTATPSTDTRRELSHTASPDALVGLLGFLSLGSGVSLRLLRRRA